MMESHFWWAVDDGPQGEAGLETTSYLRASMFDFWNNTPYDDWSVGTYAEMFEQVDLMDCLAATTGELI